MQDLITRTFNFAERIEVLVKEADKILRIIVRSITTAREKIYNNTTRRE